MKPTTDTKLRLAQVAAAEAARVGLGGLRVSDVATAAGVSTALVHYHFATKQALLAAAVEHAVATNVAAAATAFGAGTGLGTLDSVWEALQAAAGSGSGALVLEARLAARHAPELAAVAAGGVTALAEAVGKRLPALLRELGSRLTDPREETAAALAVFLDGLALALASGRPAADVRAAYDAFWLALIAAGQGGRQP